ncbi:hypothetical protein L484_018921 [Morus notabilis]|uniref:Uncharacterized protein n=1 Tax=Morus notabilis TaxID=981085 RepID=W9QRM0_9ROSA|nr:hypothetical protein L484_018921 [Morus notabilis]
MVKKLAVDSGFQAGIRAGGFNGRRTRFIFSSSGCPSPTKEDGWADIGSYPPNLKKFEYWAGPSPEVPALYWLALAVENLCS